MRDDLLRDARFLQRQYMDTEYRYVENPEKMAAFLNVYGLLRQTCREGAVQVENAEDDPGAVILYVEEKEVRVTERLQWMRARHINAQVDDVQCYWNETGGMGLMLRVRDVYKLVPRQEI